MLEDLEEAGRIGLLANCLSNPGFACYFLSGRLAASGIWRSRMDPPEYATRLPRFYQVVAMTAGLLPWEVWLWAGVCIFVLAVCEYLYRRHASSSPKESVNAPKETKPIIIWREKVPLIAGGFVSLGLIAICVIAIANPPKNLASHQQVSPPVQSSPLLAAKSNSTPTQTSAPPHSPSTPKPTSSNDNVEAYLTILFGPDSIDPIEQKSKICLGAL